MDRPDPPIDQQVPPLRSRRDMRFRDEGVEIAIGRRVAAGDEALGRREQPATAGGIARIPHPVEPGQEPVDRGRRCGGDNPDELVPVGARIGQHDSWFDFGNRRIGPAEVRQRQGAIPGDLRVAVAVEHCQRFLPPLGLDQRPPGDLHRLGTQTRVVAREQRFEHGDRSPGITTQRPAACQLDPELAGPVALATSDVGLLEYRQGAKTVSEVCERPAPQPQRLGRPAPIRIPRVRRLRLDRDLSPERAGIKRTFLALGPLGRGGQPPRVVEGIRPATRGEQHEQPHPRAPHGAPAGVAPVLRSNSRR